MDCAHEKHVQKLPALYCASELPVGVGNPDVYTQTARSEPPQSTSPEEHIIFRKPAIRGNPTRQTDPEDFGRQLHKVPTEEVAVPEAE